MRHAAAWLRGHYMRPFAERAAAWELDRERWPLAWREHAGVSDALIRVAADQLEQLFRELRTILSRYDEPEAPGSRLVSIYLAALPHDPGRPPHEPQP